MRTALPLLLACLCLTVAAPLRAQEATETPDTRGFIALWPNEIIFPQAIRFTLTTGLPTGALRSVTLTIRQNGRVLDTIRVDIAEAAERAGEFSQLAVIWNVPSDDPPRLFEDIQFGWRVTSEDGEVARVQDRLFFADPKVEWTVDEDPASRINLIVPAGELNPPALRRTVQPAYDLLREGASLPAYTFVVYAGGLSPGCTLGEDGEPVAVAPASGVTLECNPALVDALFRASDLIPLQIASSSMSSAADAIVSRFVEDRYGTGWRDNSVPDWFRAGFTQFVTPSQKSALLSPSLAAARANRLFALADMAAEPSPGDPNLPLWQAQSYGMTLYVADQLGIEGLLALAESAAGGEAFAGAYQDAMGHSPAALLPNWQRWLFTDRAVSAYNYVPYGADTPTPTSSPTPTDAPTRTPRPTATRQPSGTPTPSVTPTRTPRPPTPSVTPRPPGSLTTPTFTPTVAATAMIVSLPLSSGMAVALMIVLIVLLIGLVFVGIRLSRTR